MVFYNEIDPFMVAWLRELINEGVIAPGVVDERSIEDILPNELMGYTQCHFFAGAGVWSYALRCAGWPDDRPVWTGSCPCQPFSAAGKKGGFADERHLWPAFFHLISQCKPVTVFGEQVASSGGQAWIDTVQSDMEGIGYTFGSSDLCACGFGAPHKRQRLWFVADAGLSERAERGNATNGKQYRDGDARSKSASCGESGIVADAGSERDRRELRYRDGEEGAAESRRKAGAGATETRDSGNPRFVADMSGERCGETGGHSGRSEERAGDGGATCDMADGIEPGLEGHARHVGNRSEPGRNGTNEARPVASRGSTCGVGNSPGRQKWGTWESGEERRPERENRGPGPTNGFWSDAEWLPCRDGKARPVEPMFTALSDGSSSDLGLVRLSRRAFGEEQSEEVTIFSPLVARGKNRIGRLRGYGNALCAPVAEAWIRAYMDEMAGKR